MGQPVREIIHGVRYGVADPQFHRDPAGTIVLVGYEGQLVLDIVEDLVGGAIAPVVAIRKVAEGVSGLAQELLRGLIDQMQYLDIGAQPGTVIVGVLSPNAARGADLEPQLRQAREGLQQHAEVIQPGVAIAHVDEVILFYCGRRGSDFRPRVEREKGDVFTQQPEFAVDQLVVRMWKEKGVQIAVEKQQFPLMEELGIYSFDGAKTAVPGKGPIKVPVIESDRDPVLFGQSEEPQIRQRTRGQVMRLGQRHGQSVGFAVEEVEDLAGPQTLVKFFDQGLALRGAAGDEEHLVADVLKGLAHFARPDLGGSHGILQQPPGDVHHAAALHFSASA